MSQRRDRQKDRQTCIDFILCVKITQNKMSYLHWAESFLRKSASQAIPPILWNMKFHNWVYKSTPMVPILSQVNPVYNFPPYFFKITLLSPSY